jgi:hypothetical protein
MLNARDRELDVVKGPTPISDAIDAAKSVTLDKVRVSEEFIHPPEIPIRPRVTRPTSYSIQYYVDATIFGQVREKLGVKSRRPGSMVGRKTFQYYVDHELN